MNERHMMHWITQALECLAFVHGKRILHRDIKPSNFLVRCPAATEMVLHFKNSSITAEDCYLYQLDRTELLLSDFGESLFLPSAEDKATPKSVVGTPAFCAPEILRFWGCKDQCLYDRRADLWSMGATLYTLLLGGPSAADKGVSCLFHASAARGNMEMLTMLLITKGLYPKLMEFRYGTFPEPNFNGTLNASVYTDADLDTNGTGYKHWIYNQLQLSAIQRRFKAKWSAIPDPTLAAIDRMMALRPEDRPHSAVSIVEYLRSITSPMSAVPPPSTVNRLIHLYERSLLWQISLRDAKMSMTPAPTNLDSKEYTNWTNVTEFFTRQLTEAESMLERFKSALSVQNSARLHLYLNPVLSPNVILENIGALFRAQNNVSLARIIFTNPN
ncbi:hypothetical protein AGDE_12507 [Angomonas deanei]|uniref:non-specific serine/threonine protein kinase n=1 Tax=Angomonas deanei TaxID=59799 RepID=A0A7G2CDI2_9TRYP|nr:hypothetical protein AGDE_12507 [Angomonas deanei]CAD2217091.1 Protein kinase domain/Protein tyrosine kinase, putative [Angomonas deanei]|eukprot:EPY24097.1 hypothetical protein AGDE_12507 [Angomonas deanei]